MKTDRFQSFAEFYPFYLSEHQHPVCRQLHLVGSTVGLVVIAIALFSQQWSLLWLALGVGYGCAWVGHFVFEHNRPATFKYPLYSFLADWVMYKDILSGKIALRHRDSDSKE